MIVNAKSLCFLLLMSALVASHIESVLSDEIAERSAEPIRGGNVSLVGIKRYAFDAVPDGSLFKVLRNPSNARVAFPPGEGAQLPRLSQYDRDVFFKDETLQSFFSVNKKMLLSYRPKRNDLNIRPEDKGGREVQIFCSEGGSHELCFVKVRFCLQDKWTERGVTLYDAARLAFLRGVVRNAEGVHYKDFFSPELLEVFMDGLLPYGSSTMEGVAMSASNFYPQGYTRCWSRVSADTPLPEGYLRVHIGQSCLDGRLVPALPPDILHRVDNSVFYTAVEQLLRGSGGSPSSGKQNIRLKNIAKY